MIDTSGRGVPASLVIFPVIVLCCADACAATRNTGNSIMSTRLIMRSTGMEGMGCTGVLVELEEMLPPSALSEGRYVTEPLRRFPERIFPLRIFFPQDWVTS